MVPIKEKSLLLIKDDWIEDLSFEEVTFTNYPSSAKYFSQVHS